MTIPAAAQVDTAHPWNLVLLVSGGLLLLVATALMLAEIEPFYTLFYSFAWYGTIVVCDAWAHRRRPGVPMLLTRPAVFLSLVAWSAVAWLFFELWNLRLENWYYINVPESTLVRRLGTIIAFGTVFPGIFAIDKLLATFDVAGRLRTRPVPLPGWVDRACLLMGIAWAALVLIWPSRCFPLVWGVTVLILVPWNRRVSGAGLLADLGRGDWSRIVRLLLAGLIAGFLWEMFNIEAGSKWIYTVPGFEEFKLFEMPLLGFLGFPPFALECYVMYRSLTLAGVAVAWEPDSSRRPLAGIGRVAVVLVGLAILIVTPPLMDRFTIDSYVRPFDALPGVDESLLVEIEVGGVRSWPAFERRLASAEPLASLGAAERQRLLERVRLARLKGIGPDNVARLSVLGIDSVAALAEADPAVLSRDLARIDPDYRVVAARQRLWVRAASQRQRATLTD